jgi:YHS domain-containing protein
MDGLLSLLLFAGFFYLMMRFGCGAHMVHGGHGGHHEERQGRDPVCQMVVDPSEGYSKKFAGRDYRFCSRTCLDTFEAEPQRYVSQEGSGS